MSGSRDKKVRRELTKQLRILYMQSIRHRPWYVPGFIWNRICRTLLTRIIYGPDRKMMRRNPLHQ